MTAIDTDPPDTTAAPPRAGPAPPPDHYGIGDANYDPEIGRMLRITLGGREVHNVICYDTRQGMVEVYQASPDGQIKVDWIKQQAKTCRMYGDVKVEWRSGEKL